MVIGLGAGFCKCRRSNLCQPWPMVVNAAVLRATRKSRRSAALLGLALAALLFGCGFRRDGAAADRLRARIRAELGSEASVNVRSAYGSTTVTIRLERMPNLDSLLVQ